PIARVQRSVGGLAYLLVLAPALPVLLPEHAGRCFKPAHDRGSELRDECLILALDMLAAFQGLKGDRLGIREPSCVTGFAQGLAFRLRIGPMHEMPTDPRWSGQAALKSSDQKPELASSRSVWSANRAQNSASRSKRSWVAGSRVASAKFRQSKA